MRPPAAASGSYTVPSTSPAAARDAAAARRRRWRHRRPSGGRRPGARRGGVGEGVARTKASDTCLRPTNASSVRERETKTPRSTPPSRTHAPARPPRARCCDWPRVRVGGTVGLGADGGGAEAHIDGAAAARDDDGGGDGAGRQVCSRLFDPLVAEFGEVSAADDAAAQRTSTPAPGRARTTRTGTTLPTAVAAPSPPPPSAAAGAASSTTARRRRPPPSPSPPTARTRAHGLPNGSVGAEVGAASGRRWRRVPPPCQRASG